MKNKKLPPAYRIVKSYGQWSFVRLADFMGTSKSNVSQTLRRNRIHFENRFKYTEAINWCFNSNYSTEDLFPTIK